MKNNLVMFIICFGINVSFCHAQEENLVTNIYAKTIRVYSDYVFLGKQRTPEYFFLVFVEAVLTLSLMGFI